MAIVLAHWHALGIAVDRGGRREDEMADAALDGGLDQQCREGARPNLEGPYLAPG